MKKLSTAVNLPEAPEGRTWRVGNVSDIGDRPRFGIALIRPSSKWLPQRWFQMVVWSATIATEGRTDATIAKDIEDTALSYLDWRERVGAA